jgi:hypothetical protein
MIKEPENKALNQHWSKPFSISCETMLEILILDSLVRIDVMAR